MSTTSVSGPLPNLVITGTTSVGKTTLCTLLSVLFATRIFPSSNSSPSSSRLSKHKDQPLRHIDVSALLRTRRDLLTSYDEMCGPLEADPEALADAVEALLRDDAKQQHELDGAVKGDGAADDAEQRNSSSGSEKRRRTRGGLLLDWTRSEMWQPEWVDLVVVLKTSPRTLGDRLKKRGDSIFDIQQSIDNEATQAALAEARKRFPRSKIVVLKNDNGAHLEKNINRLVAWILQWRLDHRQDHRQQQQLQLQDAGQESHAVANVTALG